jgi:3-oxoacyl-[acyl-carrier-protein] synthase-3
MIKGQSGVRHLTDDWAEEMPVKIARDLAEQGNTSAASIPLALDRMIAEGEAKSGDVALLIAFGAGLAYAAQVVTVP